MIYTIYLFEGSFKDEKNSDSLIRESIAKYCRSREIEFDIEHAVIERPDNAKPYIKNCPVHFNTSHSGEMAVVMVGEKPCGIDIQITEVKNYRAIAGRFFTEKEQEYVEKYGLEGFFRIWVHREAYGKLTGEGVLSMMPEFIDDEGYPKIEVDKTGDYEKAFLRDVPIAADIYCCYATFDEDDEVRFEV